METLQNSRRNFLKTTAAGAAGVMVSSASSFAAPAATGAWVNGKQINPAIDNTRVVVAHDTQIFANQTNTEAAMDKMAKALAQKTNATEAWATIFQKPTGKASWADVIVGIKGGWCQQRAIAKICLELNRLGVQYSNIIYFDSNTSGVNCTGVDKYIPPLDKVKT
jgi:hypothetical protein